MVLVQQTAAAMIITYQRIETNETYHSKETDFFDDSTAELELLEIDF